MTPELISLISRNNLVTEKVTMAGIGNREITGRAGYWKDPYGSQQGLSRVTVKLLYVNPGYCRSTIAIDTRVLTMG